MMHAKEFSLIITIIITIILTLTIICVVLHYTSFNTDTEVGMLVTGTFVGYLIIFTGAVVGYILSTASDTRIDIFYSLVGVVLFVASGALLVNKYRDSIIKTDFRQKNLAKGSISIINGVLLVVDIVLTQRGG